MAPTILQGMGLYRNSNNNFSYSHQSNSNDDGGNENIHVDTNRQKQRKNRIRSLRERRPHYNNTTSNGNGTICNNDTSFSTKGSSFENNNESNDTSFASFDEFYTNHQDNHQNTAGTNHKQNEIEHEFKHERNWDWDDTANFPLKEQSTPLKQRMQHGDIDIITPPSTLQTFDYERRRKAIKTIQSNHSSIASHDQLQNHQQEQQHNSPKNKNIITTVDQLPNPNHLMDQVRFRNRFASAALVSKKLNNDNHFDDGDNTDHFPENLFRKEVEFDESGSRAKFEDAQIPTQLFLHSKNGNNGQTRSSSSSSSNSRSQFWERKNDDKKIIPSNNSASSSHDWPIVDQFDHVRKQTTSSLPLPKSNSYSNEWPSMTVPSPNHHNHDESFESFGNQSVFSDITGSVGMASPTRDYIRKRSNHMNITGTTRTRNTSEPLFEVQGGEDYDSENEKIHAVNNTASTLHLSIEEEEEEEKQQQHHNGEEEYDTTHHNTPAKKSKMQSRLASLFSNRALQYENNNSNNINKQRSKSAPKPRQNEEKQHQYLHHTSPMRTIYQHETHIDRIMTSRAASPVRSTTSGASSGYVGWPGTIGKDGTTVAITSSFSDDGVGVGRTKQLGFDPISVQNQSDDSNAKEVKAVVPLHENANVSVNVNNHDQKSMAETKEGKSKISFGFGRNIFERKQKQDKAREETPKKVEKNVRSRVSELKRRFEAENEVVDLDEVPVSDSEDEKIVEVKKDESQQRKDQTQTPQNAADIYLAKAVSRAKVSSASPRSSPVNMPDQDLNMTFPGANPPLHSNLQDVISPQKTQTDRKRDTPCLQLNIEKLNKIKDGEMMQDSKQNSSHLNNVIDVSASLRRVRSALSPEILGSIPEGDDNFRLSEEALRRNEQLSPVRSKASGANVKGFRGFLDKTKDVPNLMDDDDSCTTASTMTSEQKMIRRTDIANWKSPPSASDVLGVMSSNTKQLFDRRDQQMQSTPPYEKRNLIKPKLNSFVSPKINEEDVYIAQINPPDTSVQSSDKTNFDRRTTSREFDAKSNTSFNASEDKKSRQTGSRSVSPSDISDGVSNSSRSTLSDSSCSDDEHSVSSVDLSGYAVDPKNSRKMVKFFRNMSNSLMETAIDPCLIEDSKKAFALFEMRSRIMETDIERGLERRGGTSTVDDIALSPYFQASYRVRDAVIVSKAWREGASPADALTAFNLTKGEYSYILERDTLSNLDSDSKSSWSSHRNYMWEKVLWTDDTDFSLIRCPCPSLDGGFIRGFDIFTLGDCQSILLKLTNEYCEELRQQLKEAKSRQLIAEHFMKDEAAVATENSMTEAEDAYIEAMEEVNTTVKKLRSAENAFEMVRRKIEALVNQYENILERMDENDKFVSNSYCEGDDLSNDFAFDKEAKEQLTRRAQLAEIEAQQAKLEAEKSKQEVERIKSQKEQELTILQKKLEQLEAKSALLESDLEEKLQSQKVLAASDFYKKNNAVENGALLYAASTIGIDQDKNETKERIKAKFRQRRSIGTAEKQQKQKKLSGSVEQRLHFYERSLQAIKRN